MCCSNFVAISSLVLELLKKCRVRQRVGHPVNGSYNAAEIGVACKYCGGQHFSPSVEYQQNLLSYVGKDESEYVKQKRYASCFFLKETFTSVLKQGCTNPGRQIVEAVTRFTVAILLASPQYGIHVLHPFDIQNFQVTPTILEKIAQPSIKPWNPTQFYKIVSKHMKTKQINTPATTHSNQFQLFHDNSRQQYG